MVSENNIGVVGVNEMGEDGDGLNEKKKTKRKKEHIRQQQTNKQSITLHNN